MSEPSWRNPIPLILLPGLMNDERLWQPAASLLANEARCVIHVSCKGVTLADFASDVLRTAPERFALAGISMGGLIACEVVRQASERVLGLAVLSTVSLIPPTEPSGAFLRTLQDTHKDGMVAVFAQSLKSYYLDRRRARAEQKIAERWYDSLLDQILSLGPETFARQTSALLEDRDNWLSDLARLKMPSLVLCGADDRICPPQNHRLISRTLNQARIDPRSRDEEIPFHANVELLNTGHLSVLEQPILVTFYLKRWLRAIKKSL